MQARVAKAGAGGPDQGRAGTRKYAGAAGIMGAHARRGGRKYAGAGGRAHAEKCESRWSRANGNIQVSERGRGGKVTFWR